MTRPLALAAARPPVYLAAAGRATASPSARTITGLAVPFGQAAWVGGVPVPLVFDAESLTWSTPERVKLLTQHDQDRPLGHATALTAGDAGLVATFTVAAGPDGDRALAEAADGRRDGLSVGVELDDDTWQRAIDAWMDGDLTPVRASGRLREVSQCAVPAFDDARITATDDGQDATAGTFPDGDAAATTQTLTAAGGEHTTQEVHMARQLATAQAGAPSPADVQAAIRGYATATAQPAGQAPPTAPPAQPAGTGATTAAAPESSSGHGTTPDVAPQGPAPVQAAAGAAAAHRDEVAQVLSEPATYSFDGHGPSFVRDAFRARLEADVDAAARLSRFRAELVEMAAVGRRLAQAAVQTRTAFPEVIPPGYRPELMIAAIDQGRPINSRLQSIPITDATPFRIPVEGNFTGVADHVEGTPHATEGTLTVDEVTISPTAVSGAWRVSREMVDASNPAIDRIALSAMQREYRNVTEARAAAALAAADTTPGAAVATVTDLLGRIFDFQTQRQLPPDFVALAPGYYKGFVTETASDGRPVLPYLNPSNASGTTQAGYAGASAQGVPLVAAWALDAGEGFLVRSEDVAVFESPLLTFQFDEVEGPGVIKLALWAYHVVAVLRSAGVDYIDVDGVA